MCDTLGFLRADGAVFGKNSDRSPNEVQVLEYHPAKSGLSGMLRCTYISIPQAERTCAVLISRPAWMWGAEIGVNEFGLCIGNEAVFTRGAYGKSGLTGMDLLRLALERCRDAAGALELITGLLEEYGQGGDCGYDHHFYYDNSFLLIDRSSLYVLETAGRAWICRRSDRASISNRLSIGADFERCSAGEDGRFLRRHLEPVYSSFSGSAARRRQTQDCLRSAEAARDLLPILRAHHPRVTDPFAQGTVSSPCMHFGGAVGDHSTASMVVSLEAERSVVWATGCSAPCVSLYKPWLFGSGAVLPVAAPGDPAGERYWLEAERFRRSLLGRRLPEEFYAQRDALQNAWFDCAAGLPDGDFPAFSRRCLEEEAEFYRAWKGRSLEQARPSAAFLRRWEKKNRVLFPEG